MTFENNEQFAFERGRKTGLDIAATIAESMGYHATARAIRAGGDPDLLAFLLRTRARTVQAASSLMAGALHAVVLERARQEKLFPAEVLQDGTGGELAAELVAIVRRWCDDLNGKKENTFALVLAEEVLEALVETDLERLRKEAVQVAAVSVRWVEDIDRRIEETNRRAAT